VAMLDRDDVVDTRRDTGHLERDPVGALSFHEGFAQVDDGSAPVRGRRGFRGIDVRPSRGGQVEPEPDLAARTQVSTGLVEERCDPAHGDRRAWFAVRWANQDAVAARLAWRSGTTLSGGRRRANNPEAEVLSCPSRFCRPFARSVVGRASARAGCEKGDDAHKHLTTHTWWTGVEAAKFLVQHKQQSLPIETDIRI
jgi:hypothetical protein